MQALNNSTFTAMVIVYAVMTLLVKPIPNWACKSAKRFKQYKRRSVERSKPDSELRILMCFHAPHNLSGMTSLLKFSSSTKRSPIYAFAVHLVELTGRSTAMLIVHDTCNSSDQSQPIILERLDSEDITNTLEGSTSRRGHRMSIQRLTVVAPYANMHGDICNIAEDKRVTLILVPFHKQSSANAVLQENSYIRMVNQNLLTRAPCSVGILIDRGLHSNIHTRKLSNQFGRQQLHVAMLFAGGPDDREALAYATRMASCNFVCKLESTTFCLRT